MALRCGSSSRQFGHHVAQNSMSTGVLPTYCARSDGFPSSVSTAAAGALVPIAIPMSCARRPRGVAASILVRPSSAKLNRQVISSLESEILVPSLNQQLPTLHQIVLRHREHDEREHSFHPHHPHTGPRQPRQCPRRESNDDEQRAHAERE